MPLAALFLASAMAGQGLAVLHSPSAQEAQQRQMIGRLSDAGTPGATARREPAAPSANPSHDAAWRADHLTCTSRKGRSPEQYQHECGAWLAGEAARGAEH